MAKKVVAFIDFPKFGINRRGMKRPLVTQNRDNKKTNSASYMYIKGLVGEGERTLTKASEHVYFCSRLLGALSN